MKEKYRILHYAALCFLGGSLLIGNTAAIRYSGQITQYLCGFGINYDSEDFIQARKNGQDLAIEIASEGITRLKNQNNCLPLANKNINVFGYAGSDLGYHYRGFGSGSDSEYEKVPLYSGLEKAGFSLNPDLVEAYNNCGFVRKVGIGERKDYSLYEPDVIDNESLRKSAKEFSDTALVVIGRYGTEGLDLPKFQIDKNSRQVSNGRIYSELSEDEEKRLNYAEENFEKVIVILNAGNVRETGFLDNPKISAALDIYFPGNSGSLALGDILSGQINPSGHLPDTVAYDLSTAPSYVNSSTDGTHAYANNQDVKYIDYAENIYTGYYWYETADQEGFWDSAFAKQHWQIQNGYENVVQYPFGYGLSYSSFDWTIDSVSIPDKTAIEDSNAIIDVEVTVTNNSLSSYAGKDVVQLYYSLPYKKGGIEKPAVKLGTFAKTSLLNPGESEKLTLSLPVRDRASYDCYDKNNNGFIGYELEDGDYEISLRSDCHTLKETGNGKNIYTYHINKGFQYETDDVTGTKIENQFTTFLNPTTGASSAYTEPSLSKENKAYSIDGGDSNQGIQYRSREDFSSTFPGKKENRTRAKEFIDSSYQPNSVNNSETDERPKTSSDETDYTLKDRLGLSYDDLKWDDLTSQLSVKERADLCGNGGLHTNAVESIGKRKTLDSDGPSGFNTKVFGRDAGYTASYPCETLRAATWNNKLSYLRGCSIGKEALAAGIDGWYGPACDIHRTPLGGRNYEYYSEDPCLSGVLVSSVVQGARENGLYAFVKHFVANETENTRAGGYTWLTEQALRENYLKPFEKAVKEGKTIGIRSAYNRIGSTRTSGSYRLLTTVLRKEWGFEGCVISDYNNGNPVLCPDEAIRAGNDLRMEVTGGAKRFKDTSSATAVKCFKRGAKNILYRYTKAKYEGAKNRGIDPKSVSFQSQAKEVFPWWIMAFTGVEAVLFAGRAIWFILVFRSRKKSIKEDKEEDN